MGQNGHNAREARFGFRNVSFGANKRFSHPPIMESSTGQQEEEYEEEEEEKEKEEEKYDEKEEMEEKENKEEKKENKEEEKEQGVSPRGILLSAKKRLKLAIRPRKKWRKMLK